MRSTVLGGVIDDRIRFGQGRGTQTPAIRARDTVATKVSLAAVPATRGVGIPTSPDAGDGVINRHRPSIPLAGEPEVRVEPAVAHTRSVLVPSSSGEDGLQAERAASSHSATTSAPATASDDGPKRNAGIKSEDRRRTNGTHASSSKKSSSMRGGIFQPRAYTAQLSAASSVSELQSLFELGRAHDINSIHIATLWTRLAKLASGPDAASPIGASRSEGTTPATAAGTTLPSSRPKGCEPQAIDPALLAAFVRDLQQTTTVQQLADMESRGLSNVVWAAAKLKVKDADSSLRTSSAQPALSQSHDGMQDEAKQRSGSEVGGDEAAEASTSSPDQPRSRPLRIRGGKKAREAAAAAAAAEAAESALPGSLVSEAFLDAWAAAAQRKLSSFSMQDVSNTVWALGRLGYHPDKFFMTQLSIAILKELPRADRPQQLSNVLLGLALLRNMPAIRDFWSAIWQALDRVVLAEQKVPDAQAVSNTLWALGQLRKECVGTMQPVPQNVVSKALFRVVQWSERLTATQCQDVLVALPLLEFTPTEYQGAKLLTLAHNVLAKCDAQALSNILMALLQLRIRPPRRWRDNYLDAFQQQLPASSPEALARLLYCMSALRRCEKPAWLPEVWLKLQTESHRLPPTDVAFTILAIRRLYPELLPRETAESSESAAEMEGEPQELSSPPSEAGSDDTQSPSTAMTQEDQMAVRINRHPPPRELLLALREAWERAGPEAQLRVVFGYRALVQEYFDAVLA